MTREKAENEKMKKRRKEKKKTRKKKRKKKMSKKRKKKIKTFSMQKCAFKFQLLSRFGRKKTTTT